MRKPTVNGSKIKVSFDEPKFFVNEKKRTVVCVLPYMLQVPRFSYYYDLDDLRYGSSVLTHKCGKAIGIAKCSEDDIFSEEIGREIAGSRAEQNAYHSCHRHLINQWKLNQEYQKMLENFTETTAKVWDHNEQYIKRLGNGQVTRNPWKGE